MNIIAASLTIAAMLWGQPACGTPHVVYVSSPEQHMAWAITDVDYEPPKGVPADLPLCTIAFNINYVKWEMRNHYEIHEMQAWACTAIIHEWGHLAGQPHDPKSSIMAEELERPYWRCRKLLRRLTKAGLYGR